MALAAQAPLIFHTSTSPQSTFLSSPPQQTSSAFPSHQSQPYPIVCESHDLTTEQILEDLYSESVVIYEDEVALEHPGSTEPKPYFKPLPWWSPYAIGTSVLSFITKCLKSGLPDSYINLDSFYDLHPHTDFEAHRQNDSVISRGEIPQYVLEYAPIVHLYSKEQFWPCDIAEHLKHVTAFDSNGALREAHLHHNLTNLDELNQYDRLIYLTSDDNVEERPEWLGGKANIPKQPHNGNSGVNSTGGRSDAPVVTIVVDKGDGVVDAFYFFFYSFNLGNIVLSLRWGNHVGDWEHMAVRFKHEKPVQVWFSEHIFGQAYTYDAVEKIGKRPVGYSATGTHAMYATSGTHSYILPWGLLHDETDKGPLWDPLLNMHSYTLNTTTFELRASNITPNSPVEWFYYRGRWGDKSYPLSDSRQYGLAGQWHYVDGPTGPIGKNLGRKHICLGVGCPTEVSLENESRIRIWPEDETLGDEEIRMLLEEIGDDHAWLDQT